MANYTISETTLGAATVAETALCIRLKTPKAFANFSPGLERQRQPWGPS